MVTSERSALEGSDNYGSAHCKGGSLVNYDPVNGQPENIAITRVEEICTISSHCISGTTKDRN